MLPLFHSWSIKEQERFQLSQFYLKLTYFPLWWSLCTYRMSREHAVVHSVWEPSTNIVCILVEPPFVSPIPVEAANGSQKRAFPFLFKMKQNYIHFFICMFMYPGASWESVLSYLLCHGESPSFIIFLTYQSLPNKKISTGDSGFPKTTE